MKFNISITPRVNENLIAIGRGNGAMETSVCARCDSDGAVAVSNSFASNNPRSQGIPRTRKLSSIHANLPNLSRSDLSRHFSFPSLLSSFERITSEGVEFEKKIEFLAFIN